MTINYSILLSADMCSEYAWIPKTFECGNVIVVILPIRYCSQMLIQSMGTRIVNFYCLK